MDASLLLDTLNLIRPLSAELQMRFAGCITETVFPKRHLLLKTGEISNHIYFIKSGFARAYYHTKNAKECTAWFMGTGDLMISVLSFYRRQPSTENIELLEDTVLQSMTWMDVQGIYADFPEFNFHGRLLTEKYYCASELRAALLRSGTAAERYETLLELYPAVQKKASLNQVASYLNVTPEALCRIRASAFQKTIS